MYVRVSVRVYYIIRLKTNKHKHLSNTLNDIGIQYNSNTQEINYISKARLFR